MSVELPVAPVDTVIRRRAGSLRVSADAGEALARRIQDRGAELAVAAAERAADADRKTLRAADFGVEDVPEADALDLPIAPVDRIARLDLHDRYRVGSDARVALAGLLEARAEAIAAAGTILARHAGRRTITADDIEAYGTLEEHFETTDSRTTR